MSLFFTLSPQPKYNVIAKNFLENYNNASTDGISHLSHYYFDNTLISINIHRNNNSQLFELIGFTAMYQKMLDLGIQKIKYHDCNGACQPVGTQRNSH